LDLGRARQGEETVGVDTDFEVAICRRDGVSCARCQIAIANEKIARDERVVGVRILDLLSMAIVLLVCLYEDPEVTIRVSEGVRTA
jgi:uncharacterized protein YunC (DUF1805 family)